jgi:hypothetical protein
MDALSRSKNALKQIIGKPEQINIPCKVVKVEGATCSVEHVMDGYIIEDVRLNAASEDDEGIIVTPKVGSYVIISSIDGILYYVSMYSTIEKVDFRSEGDVCSAIDGKYSIQNKEQSLKSLINELIDAISAITVTTAVGPSGIPINISFKKALQIE